MDDTIIGTHRKEELQALFQHLNSIHPNSKFMTEAEKNNTLPFLGVLVGRRPEVHWDT
jgi:hypothetical protein